MKLYLRQKLNSEYFRIGKDDKGLFNTSILNEIDFDKYLIYKGSGKQRLVNKESVLKMEYSHYMFFRKDLYNEENINEWINYLTILYLIKPTPPFNPSKLIIKQ